MSSADAPLPSGWKWVKLSDVTTHSTEKIEPINFGDTNYIGLEHIESGSNKILGRGDLATSKSTKSVFRSGDVLYGKLRPNLKKVCRPDFDGVCSTDILVFLQGNNLDNRYLLNFLSQQSTADFATRNANGINLPRISPKSLGEIDFPLPPLSEQRRIVSKIESLQLRSSRAREALSEVGLLLEQFRKSVLQAAFNGRLTADWRATNPAPEPATVLLSHIRTERRHRWEQSERVKYEAKGKKPPKNWRAKYKQPHVADISKLHELPDTWTWASIEELLKDDGCLSYGILKPGEPDPNGVPMLRVMDIGDWRFNDTEVMHVAPELAEQYRRTRLETGDIVLAVMATIGRAAVVPEKYNGANVNRALAVLKLTACVSSDFVVSVIRSPFFQDRFIAEKVGTAQSRINLSDLRKFAIPLPPPEEAVEIVTRLNEHIESMLSIEAGIYQSESALAQLDQSILAKAFRGELVPNEADLAAAEGRDYESADTQLMRIRNELTEREMRAKQERKARSSDKLQLSEKIEVTVKRSVLNVLKESSQDLTPEELFRKAGCELCDVDDFYAQLRAGVASGDIIQKPAVPDPTNPTVLLKIKKG